MEVKLEDHRVIQGAFMFGMDSQQKVSEEEEYNDLFLTDKEVVSNKGPSVEIFVPIVLKQGNVFRMFRGLDNTGTSASLIGRELRSHLLLEERDKN